MKVLVLAPHADDLEFGCGGTVARLVGEGHEIFELVFSCAFFDMPCGLENGQRMKECTRAALLLNVDKTFPYIICDEKLHRNFAQYRQQILDKIIGYSKKINPDMAIIPCANDRHQDHQVIHAEGIRGLKGVKTILGYDTPWNHMINGNFFVPLTKEDVGKKIQAVDCYKSIQHKQYANHDFLWAWARFRGLQGGSEYAEVFELIRGGL